MVQEIEKGMVEESQSGFELLAGEGAMETSKSLKNEEKERKRKAKRRKRLLQEMEKANMKGVCYLSRIPPKMDPLKLRQVLSHYGEIERIYLVPEDPSAQIRRKKSGGFRGQGFSEGWVEFTDKRVAKRVANMLNGEEMGGKKRSQFYYDIWNMKYLSKFKWDDLTEETAQKNATREQKLQMELSAARKERDFYLSKVEQSRALTEIEERMKKKRKVQDATETDSGSKSVEQQKPKVVRQFHQKQTIASKMEKPKLSKDVLAKVFNTKNDQE